MSQMTLIEDIDAMVERLNKRYAVTDDEAAALLLRCKQALRSQEFPTNIMVVSDTGEIKKLP